MEGICTEPLCSVDADCAQGEYCSTEGCITGCITGNSCGTCGECVNHICQEPECCQDSDCKVIKLHCESRVYIFTSFEALWEKVKKFTAKA